MSNTKITNASGGSPSQALQGVLPTPVIREIKLSYSPLPPPVSNPHIDHAREVIIYTDRAGKRAFKHPGFTVKKDPRNLLIEVTVVLKDNISTSGQSNWILQEGLLKYMHLQLIHSEDPTFTDMVKTRQIDPMPSQVKQKMPNNGKVKCEIRSLGGLQSLEGFYNDKIEEPGGKEVAFHYNFAVNTINPEHLTYFANVFLDTDQLINDYSLNLNDEMIFTSCGDTVVESVYKDGQRVSHAKVYSRKNAKRTPRNAEYFAGQVYKVSGNVHISSEILNDDMIRGDLLNIITTLGTPRAGSAASRYLRKLRKITQNDSAKHTKYQQLQQMLKGMKNRNANTVEGQLYRQLQQRYEKYNQRIAKAAQFVEMQVPNKTIKDIRSIEDMTTLPLEQPETEDENLDTIDIRSRDRSSADNLAAINLKNAKYFSRAMITRDTTAATRLAFFLDWRKLAMDSSAHKRLMMRAERDIEDLLFSKIQIKSMRLIRERVDDENTLSQFDNHMTRDRESVVEVISDAFYNNSTGTVKGVRTARTRTSTEESFVGSLDEMKLPGVTDNNLRAFAAYDSSIRTRRAGKFKYRVEISFIDEIGDLLYKKVLGLRTAIEALQKYYNICTLPCNYDTYSGRFTEFFIASLYETYGLPSARDISQMTIEDYNALLDSSSSSRSKNTSPLMAPWLRPITKYIELIKIIKSMPTSDAHDLAKKIQSQLEPNSASPDTVLSVIKMFQELEENVIKSLFSSGRETSGLSLGRSKISSKLTKTYRLSYQFADAYDNKALSNVGSRYLFYGEESRNGLAKITKELFLRRMEEEQTRFFKNTPIRSNIAIEDLGTYKFSYMAPADIRVGGKRLPLLNRGESLFTSDQYKEMMFSISLLKSNPTARSITMPILNQQIGSTAQSSKTDQKTAKLNMGAIELMSRYGISIKPPTPYSIRRTVKDEPFVEVGEILGEDTLLAIKNEIIVNNKDPEETDEIVTDLANAQVSMADVTLFASSLVGTLAATGLQNFMGTMDAQKQISTFSEDKSEEIGVSKTLEFFDLANPFNALDRQTSKSTGLDDQLKIRKIPNQIKSLFLAKTGQVALKKNWHQSEVDPIASPDTRPLFEILYFNLQKIEVLTGFNASKSGGKILRSPSYELLEPKHLEQDGMLLCRLSRYRNDTLQIGQSRLLDLPVYNQYFILNLDKTAQTTTNPIVSRGLYTSGGEYQTPNGTNYIGYYHVHRDGTVMTGIDMGLNEQRLIPSSSTATQPKAITSGLVNKLLAEDAQISGFERNMLITLVTDNYVMEKVSSDQCSTEPTIMSSQRRRSRIPGGNVF